MSSKAGRLHLLCRTNRIVTCSADRNAYVWVQVPGLSSSPSLLPQQGDGTWRHTLVLLRINRFPFLSHSILN